MRSMMGNAYERTQAGEKPYPWKVVFPGAVEWWGQWDGLHFTVEDVVDRGVSEREVSGRGPGLRPIPAAAIQAKGGRVLPFGSLD